VKQLMSGNEAIARGAWEADVVVAAGYPGTPSTEILENFAGYPKAYAEWAPNEKVALDVVVGAAYAGRRAMAVMKHVGLNVASDSLFYASTTGVEAGLVIIGVDDPGQHSSQNEQDSRRYGKFARIPCIEPSDSQEAKDMVAVALNISEQFDTPVLLRSTTRISHSSALVNLGEQMHVPPTLNRFPRNPAKYHVAPLYSRKRRSIVEERINLLCEFAETFPYNLVEWRSENTSDERAQLGIVTCGVAYQYAKEVFPESPILRLGMTYPIPPALVREFASKVERLIVIEELDPFLEEEIHLLGIPVEGKSIFPKVGELNPRIVRRSAMQVGLLPASANEPVCALDKPPVPARRPTLCPGCPHRGVFQVLSKLDLVVAGDIGCYCLASEPPLSALHTQGCMGAGIGQAHGAAKAGIGEPMVAVIGDSTFFHAGIPALLNVAYNQSNVIVIILDNRATAMTGHQQHPGTGFTLQMQESPAIELESLVRALGIERVTTVDPYQVWDVEKILREFMRADGPSVLIAQRECARLPRAREQWVVLEVAPEKCRGCARCFSIGCPAILKSDELDKETQRPKAVIDSLQCVGCEVCAWVCPWGAISFRDQVEGAHDE